MASGHKRELTRILAQLQAQGWTVELKRSGHYRLKGPAGQLYFTGSTPSDHRGLLNLKGDLRRLGAKLD